VQGGFEEFSSAVSKSIRLPLQLEVDGTRACAARWSALLARVA